MYSCYWDNVGLLTPWIGMECPMWMRQLSTRFLVTYGGPFSRDGALQVVPFVPLTI